jgi:hypothetical protein
LRIAVVALRGFAIAAGLFALSGLASVISQIVRGKTELVFPFFSMFLLGLAAAAAFFVLSESGVILIRLEEQGEHLQQQLYRLRDSSSGAAKESAEESE